MIAIETQILRARGISLQEQNALLNTHIQQLARRLARQPAVKTILRVHRVPNEIRHADYRAPRLVAIDVIEELQKLRVKSIHRVRLELGGRRIEGNSWQTPGACRQG